MKGNKKGSPDLFGKVNNPAEVIVSDLKAVDIKETIETSVKTRMDSEHLEVKKEVNNLRTKVFTEDPVRLFVDYSRTVNMGNYESAKISVGLSIPLGREIDNATKAEIDAAYKYASEYIENKMAIEVKGVQDYVKSKK